MALVVCDELLRSRVGRRLIRVHRQRGALIVAATRAEFERLSILGEPQGLAAVIRQRWHRLPTRAHLGAGVWLGFDQLRSPGNLGTMMRTARAAGVDGCIFSSHDTDPFDPRAVRPSMGALFGLRLIRCSGGELARWKRSTGCVAIGASSHARQHFRSREYRGPTILLLGSERTGLSESQRRLADHLVRIPMSGDVDSLNVGVAAGVLLYEIFEQRHPRPKRPRRSGQTRRR